MTEPTQTTFGGGGPSFSPSLVVVLRRLVVGLIRESCLRRGRQPIAHANP